MDEAIWTAEGDRKRAAVQRMFAEIAPRYDLLNSLLSLRLHRRWRALAVALLDLRPGDRALDVCCGTGDFLVPLRRAVGPQGRLWGVDFCLPMLQRAREKVAGEALAMGDACRLPVRDGAVDAVTVGWGIRNTPDVDAAHREIARALRPGGRFASIDMAVPRNPLVRALSRFVTRRLVPAVGALFGSREAYTYLPESTRRFLDREALADSMRRAGFRDVRYRDLMLGNVCVHWGVKA